jgi:succinate dehydrogenase / fumarate reductase cytochrome b subunit
MNWFTRFLTSSIGKKLIMSLTGLFLCLFLIVHLAGNLQLLLDDGGNAFNLYAYTMTHNPLIKAVSYGTYFFIVLHAIQGIVLALQNRKARNSNYAVKVTRTTGTSSFAARQMALLGSLILIFLGIHMGDFWWKMKSNQTNTLTIEGIEVQDLYEKVAASFSVEWIVAFSVVAMIGLCFHLLHGFQSAFQTLGLNHKKYTPFIQLLGKGFAILVPTLFALIPLYFYFVK